MATSKAQQGRTDRVIEALVAAFAVAAMAVGVSMVGGGQASAPEPARLTQPLGSTTGATAAAVYVETATETKVLRWSGSWTAGNSIAPGTPCSRVELMEGETTDMVIQASGVYRRCI